MSLLKSIQRDPELARELAQCVESKRPFRLLDLKLYLTRRCNLRCAMCTAWQERDAQDELSTDEVARLLEQARSLGLAHLKLFGGEPMLRQDLDAIVEHAAGLGVRCTLITNGSLLTGQRAEALVRAGLAQLDLSLDAGSASLHDAIRGVPGTWQRAVDGLQAVQSAAGRLGRRVTVRVNAVVMRQNVLDLPRLVSQAVSLGVDQVVFNPAIPQRDNARGPAASYVLTRQDILRYNDEVAPAILKQDTPYRWSVDPAFLYIYGTRDEDVDNAAQCRYVERLQIERCFKPWYYMVIRENGDVLGCNTVKHPLGRLGNVRRKSVEEIWFSDAFRQFRAACTPPRFAECARCCYNLALLNRRLGQALAREHQVQESKPQYRESHT
ncbi:MAG: radical SAM protein [Thermoflexales bacterium]|nr:radical SAM protein [Thermoflexales bacterium]